jgi:hypothetical protein
MSRMRDGLVGCVVASALIVGCPAQSLGAGLALFTAGGSTASFIPALIGEIAGVGVVTAGATTTGQVVTVGSGLVTFFDPPGGIFIDGRISLDFDPAFLEVTDYGWLGDWGANAAVPAPPVTSGPFIPAGTLVVLQPPNPQMNASVSVDNSAGNITVAYDWGLSGHPAPPDVDDVNFFSTVFTTKSALADIGDLYAHIQFSASNFTRCVPRGSDEVQLCGAAAVPGPVIGSGLSGVLAVFGGGGLLAWWRRRQKIA